MYKFFGRLERQAETRVHGAVRAGLQKGHPVAGDIELVLDSFARNCEDHPVTRRDESDITAVELAALHHELAVDPLALVSRLRGGATLTLFRRCIPAVAGVDPDLPYGWNVRRAVSTRTKQRRREQRP